MERAGWWVRCVVQERLGYGVSGPVRFLSSFYYVISIVLGVAVMSLARVRQRK